MSKKNDPAVLEYIAEGKEIIERVSKNLSSVESGNSSQEILSSIYRDVHTLKGSSQLFGFKATAQVSHALEACLDPVRKGISKLSPALMEASAKSMDLLDRLLNSIEATGAEPEDSTENIKYVSRLVEAATTSGTNKFPLAKDDLPVNEYGSKEKSIAALSKMQKIINQEVKKVEVETMSIKNIPPTSNEPPAIENKNIPQNQSTTAIIHTNQNTPANPNVSTNQNAAAPVAAAPGEGTIRVHVSLLDRILTLVGELVLIKNQLGQYRQRIEDTDFLNASKSLDVVTSDLQGEIMKTRMQPIETVVGKFQRVVRDIARDLSKKIDLTLEGSETELDKSLLEAIKDPLTHIVRNSCDHGIENPDERKAANKPETGHLLIRSFHEGGQVVIEVSDDGRGINRNRVMQKAVEKGILTQEKASSLSDREICEIIFLPGFSTAQQVTSVSGRGVGMDVVKTNIEKIGGSVEIKSVQGKGTTIQLRIPLTLAIVPALIIKSKNLKFAIPQVKLVELVHVEGSSTGAQIEKLQGKPMFRLRGQLLPLYDLREITKENFDPEYKDGVFIVVLNADGENFGLLVPEVSDTADIVVKPMSSLLNNLSTFSGATILGDGSIALIIDVDGVAEFGRILNKRAQKEDREAFAKQEKGGVSTDIQEFLLFSTGVNTLHSLPLCLVNRLEEFSNEQIEMSGEQRVVRYRGGLLPLLSVNNTLNYKNEEKNKEENSNVNIRTPVIVVQRSGRNYGLVVNEIVDVMTIEGQIDDSVRDRNGILGNLVHNNEIIVVIDALGIIEEFNRKISGKSSSVNSERDVMGELKTLNKEMKFKSIRVLYAEDVAFFRKHVSKVLAAAGIDVTTVEDGQKAIQELDAADADRYNLILSDIEMPHMNGIELAKEIRKREKFKNIPMIALTTRFRNVDIENGKAAGFNSYLEKLNPEKLMQAIQELMGAEMSEAKVLTIDSYREGKKVL